MNGSLLVNSEREAIGNGFVLAALLLLPAYNTKITIIMESTIATCIYLPNLLALCRASSGESSTRSIRCQNQVGSMFVTHIAEGYHTEGTC